MDLGNWQRARQYAEDVIGDLNSGAAQWTDWNMALSIDGGPNHADNLCDAPIVVDAGNGVYYKQPMYYALAHFSRLVRPGFSRVAHSLSGQSAEDRTVSGDGERTVAVLLNTDTRHRHSVQVQVSRYGVTQIDMPPNSIQTLYWS